MKNNPIPVIAVLLLGLLLIPAGCAKEDVTIGREAPEIEIQKCMRLSEKKKFEEAIECLEIFKSRFPQTTYGTEAELAIADNYFKNKEYLLAADSYQIFIRLHPTHPKVDYAYYRLGLSYFKESPKAIDRDQQYLDDSVRYLNIAVVSFPESPYHEAAMDGLKDARRRIAEREFYIGRFYYRTGEMRAAMPRFLEVVNNYPESSLAPKSLYKLIILAGKLKQADNAKLFFSKLTMDYPDNRWTKKAEPKVAKIVNRGGAAASPPDGEEGGIQ